MERSQESVKRFEIVQRVSNILKLGRRFNEFNRIFEDKNTLVIDLGMF